MSEDVVNAKLVIPYSTIAANCPIASSPTKANAINAIQTLFSIQKAFALIRMNSVTRWMKMESALNACQHIIIALNCKSVSRKLKDVSIIIKTNATPANLPSLLTTADALLMVASHIAAQDVHNANILIVSQRKKLALSLTALKLLTMSACNAKKVLH